MKMNAVVIIMILGVVGLSYADGEPKASEVFEKRILPIFKSPNPSSCTE